jgi:hypothetical protein
VNASRTQKGAEVREDLFGYLQRPFANFCVRLDHSLY